MLTNRTSSALAALALLTAPAFAEPPRAEAEAKPEVKHFQSARKDIGADYFAPTAPGKYPVLVALPAVDGIDGDGGGPYRGAAQAAAARGYVVLLVHYFDRTGTAKKDVEGYRELFCNYFRRDEHKAEDLKRMKSLSDEWTEVVCDAVAYARTLPNVDGERVGLVGFSLGGTLALMAAARHDLKLAALVEFFGALPRELRPDLKKLPPTLVIHGDEDKVVPVEEAYVLVGLLSVRKLTCEAEVYPGVGHMFFKDGKTRQDLDRVKAALRTADFLDKHLKPGGTAATAK
jgi:carboxymethylenebutenolidase